MKINKITTIKMNTDMSKDKDIQEGNDLIAKFNGAVIIDDDVPKLAGLYYLGGTHKDLFPNGNHYARPDQLAYHSSWDWLMPVVKKIDKWRDDNGDQYFERILDFMDLEQLDPLRLLDMGITNSISFVWQGVIDFIKWYNSQNSTNDK